MQLNSDKTTHTPEGLLVQYTAALRAAGSLIQVEVLGGATLEQNSRGIEICSIMPEARNGVVGLAVTFVKKMRSIPRLPGINRREFNRLTGEITEDTRRCHNMFQFVIIFWLYIQVGRSTVFFSLAG